MEGLLGNALGTLEGVLEDLEVGGTVDELLKGRLEDVRDTLQEVLSQAGEQVEGGVARQGLPEGPTAEESSSKASREAKEEE